MALSSAVVSEITWLSTDTSTSPGLTPALSAGPPWTNGSDQRTILGIEPERLGDLGRQVLWLHTNPAAVTVPDEMIDSITCLAVETGSRSQSRASRRSASRSPY